ncbi:MAG: hypothetical protein ABR973_17380 [Candidatus Acidiferrales bacterium]|jgi:cytochrome c oxidase assembly factor CtaG
MIEIALAFAASMLVIVYGGQYVTTRVRGFTRYTPVLHHAFGAATLLVAIALYTQYDAEMILWLSDFYPNLQMGL